MDFTVDFKGSRNVHFENHNGLLKKTILQPFTKVIVAKLLLDKQWNLKTKFKFSLRLPDLDTQEKYITPLVNELNRDINQTRELKRIDFDNLPQESLFSYLRMKKWNFIDHDFLPTNKSIGLREDDIIDKYECYIQWRKAKDILLSLEEAKNNTHLNYIFLEGIEPKDIK